jgi:hypothetical protein
MEAISGQGTQGMQATGMDPFALGARQGAQSGGRSLGGTLGAAAQQHQPRIGLAGMRSPTTSAKPLSSAIPMARPVKSPLINQSTSAATLPEPVHQKVVRSPIMPIQPQTQPITQIEQKPTIVQPVSTPIVPIEQVEEVVVEEETIADIDIEDEMAEAISEELVAELEEEPKTALLTPIKTKLSVAEPEQQKVASLTPIKQLQPVKKMRGSPPSSGKGEAPPLKTLTPVKKLTPLKIERRKMQPSKENEEDN